MRIPVRAVRPRHPSLQWSASGTLPDKPSFVLGTQRRRDSNIGSEPRRGVGCCIHTSIIRPFRSDMCRPHALAAGLCAADAESPRGSIRPAPSFERRQRLPARYFLIRPSGMRWRTQRADRFSGCRPELRANRRHARDRQSRRICYRSQLQKRVAGRCCRVASAISASVTRKPP